MSRLSLTIGPSESVSNFLINTFNNEPKKPMRKKLNQIKKYRTRACRHLASCERYKSLAILTLFGSIALACFTLWHFVLWLSIISVLFGVLGLISIELFYLNYDLWKTTHKELKQDCHDGGYDETTSGGGMESEENSGQGARIGNLERTPSPLTV